MAKLYYQGHGSYRITTNDGTVIYLDPFAGGGYDVPADLILVTHEHGDHNVVELPAKKEGCVIWRAADFLKDGVYQTKTFGGITIRSVEAYNKKHPREECVGYVLTLSDGVRIYVSGDTSKTKQMPLLASQQIDYAFFCCDGVYNMGLKEAVRCAEPVEAKHNIPYHNSTSNRGEMFDRDLAEQFNTPNRLIVYPGEQLELR